MSELNKRRRKESKNKPRKRPLEMKLVQRLKLMRPRRKKKEHPKKLRLSKSKLNRKMIPDYKWHSRMKEKRSRLRLQCLHQDKLPQLLFQSLPSKLNLLKRPAKL